MVATHQGQNEEEEQAGKEQKETKIKPNIYIKKNTERVRQKFYMSIYGTGILNK
jgi:hypothetical protein